MNPPDAPRERDVFPGAAWFGQLIQYLKSVRLVVAEGSGLTATPGPGGTILSLQRGRQPAYAYTTSTIPAFNPTAKVLGKGTAAIYRISINSSTGVATLVPIGGPDVTIYNADVGSPAGTGIATGRLIQVKVIDGEWNVDVDYCGGG